MKMSTCGSSAISWQDECLVLTILCQSLRDRAIFVFHTYLQPVNPDSPTKYTSFFHRATSASLFAQTDNITCYWLSVRRLKWEVVSVHESLPALSSHSWTDPNIVSVQMWTHYQPQSHQRPSFFFHIWNTDWPNCPTMYAQSCRQGEKENSCLHSMWTIYLRFPPKSWIKWRLHPMIMSKSGTTQCWSSSPTFT